MRQLLFTIIILTSLSSIGQNQKVYELNTLESIIHWKGSYAFSFSEHVGTVHFQKGELQTIDGNITGGDFVIGMYSITNEDHKLQRGPVEHLKNKDFFDVKMFPEAKLVFTNVEYFKDENIHRIYADLTIKGITKPIEFYANANGTEKTLEAKFKIDRTRWGITYNNKLKNEAISDAIEFNALLQF